MQNIVMINAFFQIFGSILLIYYVLRYQKLEEKYNKEVLENIKNKNILYHVENAVYDILDLEGKNRPLLNFNETLSDIVNFRTLANKYEGIKPEYEELVEKQKIAESLRNDFRNNEFTKKFILENMPNELIAIEVLKALKNKDLVINANNSKILELEELKETLKDIKPFKLNEENKKLQCRIGGVKRIFRRNQKRV